MKCMPNSHPSVIKCIDTLYKFFSQIHIDSKTEGTLNKFVCDFIQDEFGHFHFLKIHDFGTDGNPLNQ